MGDKFHVDEPRDKGGFVWHKRGDELRYLVARSGDHLQCPFQCDLCIFRTLKGMEPGRQLADRALQRCIRRINLDALWARDPKTVASTRNATTRGIALSMTVGIAPPYPNLGTFPLQDTQGFGVAVQMVLASLNKGTYADYCQFDSIRGYRTAHANVYRASATGSGRTMVMIDQDNSCKRVTSSPTESDRFGRFTRGCKLRMGQISKSDLAMSVDTVVLYMDKIEARALQSVDPKTQRLWVSVGAYSLLCYVGSLRGNEGFLLDLYGLRLYLGEGKTQNDKAHIVAPLMGRFKNELGERYHLILLAATTASGLNPREWLEWLVTVRQEEGRTRGPAFCDEAGMVAYSRNYEDLFIEVLSEIQEEKT